MLKIRILDWRNRECVRRSHWLVQSVSSVTTTLRRIRRIIRTEWKPRNIVDSAKLILYTRKPNNYAVV